MHLTELRKTHKKLDDLCVGIKDLGSLVVAFSGGVDSSFLLRVATEILKDRAVALTVNSPYIAEWEIEEARELTSAFGASHTFLNVEIPEAIAYNPEDRCYLCKHVIFSSIKAFAAERGYRYVVDGSNADDSKDYRPGMRALKELGIRSPLLEHGITKDDIRAWSRALGLGTWDKPPYACLLTRLPYGTRVEIEDLRMIEEAEAYLIKKGIRAVRVRKHDQIARIEVDESDFEKMLDTKTMKEVGDRLKAIGFAFVTMDLMGYTMGSFNQGLSDERTLYEQS